jgi:hypothetical protein
MPIHLHKQATTTPKIRAAIQASDEPASVLAERFGTTGPTVYKWKCRDSVHDRSHTPHRLQTSLTPAQEAVAVDAAFEARMARHSIRDITHRIEVQEECGMGS